MNRTEEKIANPLKFYRKPIEVERDKTLSIKKKIKLLQNWLDDINLRAIATTENMPDFEEGKSYVKEVEQLLNHYIEQSPPT